MSTIRNFITTIITLALTINSVAQNAKAVKPRIEIYFLNKLNKDDTSQPRNNYFVPTTEELSDKPFITDDEIIGYRIYEDTLQQKTGTQYSILLANSAQ
jgi:hypothetical protein